MKARNKKQQKRKNKYIIPQIAKIRRQAVAAGHKV